MTVYLQMTACEMSAKNMINTQGNEYTGQCTLMRQDIKIVLYVKVSKRRKDICLFILLFSQISATTSVLYVFY